MGFKRYWLASATAIGFATGAWAQLPAIGQPAPPPPNPLGIAPYPAQPGTPTIWEKLGVSKAQQEYCRRGTCRTPFGQGMNAIVNPLSKLSGGLISPFCPITPSLAELQDPGAVGAAAKIKQDRAGAEERIKAVKYLGSVDCHYWPEAEEALIGALRNDRNECVRYEAAVVLGKGCCCTPKVIVALSNSVACSTADGGFMEKSARVRQAAQAALEHCMPGYCSCPDIAPLQFEDDKKKKGGEGGGGEVKPMSFSAGEAKPGPNGGDIYDNLRTFYTKVGKLPKKEIVRYATDAMLIGSQLGDTVDSTLNPNDLAAAGVPTTATAMAVSSGPRPSNLWDIITKPSQTPTMAYAPMPAVQKPGNMAYAPMTQPAKTTTMASMPSALETRTPMATVEPPMRKTLIQDAPKSAQMVSKPVAKPAAPMAMPVKPAPVMTPVVAPAMVKKEPVAMKPMPEMKPQPTMAPMVAVTPAPMAEVLVPVAPTPVQVNTGFPDEPVSLRPAIPARR